MLTLVMPRDAHPACADPALLPLVDAAFDHTRGRGGTAKQAQRLYDAACHRCPVAGECLALAMLGHEHGPWAGTTGPERGQPADHSTNLRDLHRKATA